MGENLMSLARSGEKYLKLFGDGEMVKKLPYDAEVEWLRSDGKAYIETDSISDMNSELSIHLTLDSGFPANRCFFGAFSSDSEEVKNYILSRTYTGGKTYSSFCTNGAVGIANVLPKIDDVWLSVNKSGFYVDGVRLYNLYQDNVFVPAKICVFYYIKDGKLGGHNKLDCANVFEFRHSISGEIVCDLIPIRFTNESGQSEGAMYDRVSGQLFRNAGTGAFVVGPDKTT